ncbi:hypothetical protein LP416_30220 [Polaromonas sp. P2-4]|nr:hypothetical protein LP416_30220 [Polaromonas sp. P2-4]
MAFLACSLGATGAVSRYVAEFSSDAVKLTAFIQKWQPWALVLPVLAGGAVLVGAWMSGLTFDLISVLFLVLWAVASAAWAMQTAALTGFQRFDLIFYANLLAAGTMLAGVFVLPLSPDNPAILFVLMAAAVGMAALLGLSETHRVKGAVSVSLGVDQWQSIRRYALNMWLIALLWALLWSRGELPLVRSFMGDAGVASYAAVLTLFGGAIQGVMLGVSAVAPQLTRLWGEGRQDAALAMARSVMDLQLLVCGGAAIVLICFGPELMELAFGARYRAQAETLAILSVALVSMALSNQNHLLQIATNGRFSRNASLVGLAVLMALAFVLIPMFGVLGAALARAITMIFLALISIIAVIRMWRVTSLSMRNLAGVITIVGLCLSVALLFPLHDAVTRIGILFGSFVLLALAVRDEAGMLKARTVVWTIWHSLPALICQRQ